jgi:hypothetical protein
MRAEVQRAEGLRFKVQSVAFSVQGSGIKVKATLSCSPAVLILLYLSLSVPESLNHHLAPSLSMLLASCLMLTLLPDNNIFY